MSPQLTSFVREKVDSGLDASASEVVREALRWFAASGGDPSRVPGLLDLGPPRPGPPLRLCVLDASFAMTWVFADEADPTAEALLTRLEGADSVVVPAVLWSAVAAHAAGVGRWAG